MTLVLSSPNWKPFPPLSKTIGAALRLLWVDGVGVGFEDEGEEGCFEEEEGWVEGEDEDFFVEVEDVCLEEEEEEDAL
jgi:hypothetical protein